MAKITISLSDELIAYLDRHAENRSALIEALLQQWRKHQEEEILFEPYVVVNELELGWEHDWHEVAIVDWETSEM
jgi:metal-responsive CopG/Arc/MetJ family transcriptional regulator